MLTLKGSLVGLVIFIVVVIGRGLLVRTPQPPGGIVGWDIRTMADLTVRDPMFWIVFIVCCSAGSMIVQRWQR